MQSLYYIPAMNNWNLKLKLYQDSKNEIFSVNLTKYAQDLYEENYETDEIYQKTKYKDIPCLQLRRLSVVKMSVLPNLIYRCSTARYFVDIDKHSKIYVERQVPQCGQRGTKQGWRTDTACLQASLKAAVTVVKEQRAQKQTHINRVTFPAAEEQRQSFQQVVLEQLDVHMRKMNPLTGPTPFMEINSKQIKHKCKIQKYKAKR